MSHHIENKSNYEPEYSISRRDFIQGVLGVSVLALSDCIIDTMQSNSEATNDNVEFETTPSWEQDFSGMPNGPVDSNVWRFELDPEVPTYNDEAQAYTDSEKNVRIEDGKLVIEARRESYVYPEDASLQYELTSGRIDTRDRFDFDYGKFEVTMKLPVGSGTWPAVWFLSETQVFTDKLNPSDEDWAQPRFYMHNGELDLIEAYGDKPGYIEGTLHTFNESKGYGTTVNDSAEAFHTYGVEVSPSVIVWTIDGKPFATHTKVSDNPDDWPFGSGNRFYAIFNLAMGSVAGEPDTEENSWRMEVKNARFFEYAGK